MGLDCIIIVPAGSSNSAPKKPIEDAVSRFTKDSEHYYKHVFDHIKACDKCDPVEALNGYLKNRENKQSFGRTSGLLVKLAYRYRKELPDRVPEEMPRTFLERSLAHAWDAFMERAEDDPSIGVENVERAIEFEETAWRREIIASLPSLRKMAEMGVQKLVLGFVSDPRGSPQPFFNLSYQLLRDTKRPAQEKNSLQDQAMKMVLAFSRRDYSRDPDTHVAKAVKLIRILKGNLREGRVLALPSRPGEGRTTSISAYEMDVDPEVRALARAIIVCSVMES